MFNLLRSALSDFFFGFCSCRTHSILWNKRISNRSSYFLFLWFLFISLFSYKFFILFLISYYIILNYSIKKYNGEIDLVNNKLELIKKCTENIKLSCFESFSVLYRLTNLMLHSFKKIFQNSMVILLLLTYVFVLKVIIGFLWILINAVMT